MALEVMYIPPVWVLIMAVCVCQMRLRHDFDETSCRSACEACGARAPSMALGRLERRPWRSHGLACVASQRLRVHDMCFIAKSP